MLFYSRHTYLWWAVLNRPECVYRKCTFGKPLEYLATSGANIYALGTILIINIYSISGTWPTRTMYHRGLNRSQSDRAHVLQADWVAKI